jgi:hypothetical protein
LIAVAVVGGRIWARLDGLAPPFAIDAALVDFRDAVYYPVVAFLDGENPYDRVRMFERYPVNGTIGLYSPLTLLLHLPWGLLPYRAAELGFVTYSFGMTVLLALLAWRSTERRVGLAGVLGLAAVLVITRPGHWNLVLGQVALETAVVTLGALWLARERPGLAGLALSVATFKATYGLPLAALMAARGDRRALAVGAAGALALTAPVVGVLLVRTGLDGLATSIVGNYAARAATPSMGAAQSLFRVDAVALAGRLLGHDPGWLVTLAVGGAVLAIAAAALRAAERRAAPDAGTSSLAIATLAILLCTYHQQYDVVLLAPLLLTLLPRAPLRRAQIPAALIAVPFVNYLASGAMLRGAAVSERTMLALSSINALALLAAFALLCARALRTELHT